MGASSRIDAPLTTRGKVSHMPKKVVPLPSRRATPTKTVSKRESRVVIRLGKQRYALDITCQASVLPPDPEPASRLIETKFIRLRKPLAPGERIDGWRMCWVGGWDRGKVAIRTSCPARHPSPKKAPLPTWRQSRLSLNVLSRLKRPPLHSDRAFVLHPTWFSSRRQSGSSRCCHAVFRNGSRLSTASVEHSLTRAGWRR